MNCQKHILLLKLCEINNTRKANCNEWNKTEQI